MATAMIIVVVAHVCVCVNFVVTCRINQKFNALAVDSYRVNHCS